MRAALHCVKQARLVKLQRDMLTSGQKIKVINLNKEEVEKFIHTHHKFIEVIQSSTGRLITDTSCHIETK